MKKVYWISVQYVVRQKKITIYNVLVINKIKKLSTLHCSFTDDCGLLLFLHTVRYTSKLHDRVIQIGQNLSKNGKEGCCFHSFLRPKREK
jgi:hypothetical protein